MAPTEINIQLLIELNYNTRETDHLAFRTVCVRESRNDMMLEKYEN